jgi:hypothetical protein
MSHIPYQDPFIPELFASPVLAVSDEQKFYINRVLALTCSDSDSHLRAFEAIMYILNTGNVTKDPLAIVDLVPRDMIVGSPDSILHVIGTGCTLMTRVYWDNRVQVPTTFVSEHEVTTVISALTLTQYKNWPIQLQNEPGGPLSNVIMLIVHPEIEERQ